MKNACVGVLSIIVPHIIYRNCCRE